MGQKIKKFHDRFFNYSGEILELIESTLKKATSIKVWQDRSELALFDRISPKDEIGG
jgi:hypothetical protein